MDSQTQLIPELQHWHSQGQYWSWQGHRWFYGEQGQGPALVLIHGFPSACWDWQYLLPTLGQRFRVVYLDMLGFGFSDKPVTAYDLCQQADAFEALCQQLGIEEAHLIAHDYGDSVAQELLARQNGGEAKVRWRSAALLNGGLFPDAHQPLLIQKLLASSIGPYIAPLIGEAAFRRSLNKIWGKQPPSETELTGLWQLMSVNQGQRALPYLIRYMHQRRVHQQRWFDALDQSQIPITLIDGVDDPISGHSLVNYFADHLPQHPIARLNGVGHYPQLEAPERVLDALNQFWDTAVGAEVTE